MGESKKGLVMDTTPEGSVTVMTPDGEFISLKWSKTALPEIGSEVEFTRPELKQPVFTARRFLAVAACFLALILGVSAWPGLFIPESQRVVAYINVDINPSVELGINSKAEVIEARGLNEDGNKLLERLNLINVPSEQAMQMIADEAMKEGYLAAEKENAVLITISGNEKKIPEQVKKLDQQVKQVLEKNKVAADTNIVEVPAKMRERAKELEVSTGKYVILVEAAEQGLELSVEEVRNNSIVKAIKEAGGIPGQVISGARKDKEKIAQAQKRFEEKLAETRKKQGEKPKTPRGEKKNGDRDNADDKDKSRADGGNEDNTKDSDRSRADGRDEDNAEDRDKDRADCGDEDKPEDRDRSRADGRDEDNAEDRDKDRADGGDEDKPEDRDRSRADSRDNKDNDRENRDNRDARDNKETSGSGSGDNVRDGGSASDGKTGGNKSQNAGDGRDESAGKGPGDDKDKDDGKDKKPAQRINGGGAKKQAEPDKTVVQKRLQAIRDMVKRLREDASRRFQRTGNR